MGSTRRARRPLPPKKCVSLPNKGGQIKRTRQKWGQRSLPLDRTERCRSFGGAWVPRPDGRPALKNSLDYTAASFFGQCCNFIDIPAPFWSFFRRKTKNKNVSKKHLAYRKPLRYDRVDPPYGLFSSHRKLVPQKRCFVAFEGPYLFTDQCVQNASAMPGSLPMLQGRKMSSLPPARPTGVKSPLSGN